MTMIANPYDAIATAVDAALADLVKVSHWRDGAVVSLPLLFVGGTNVAIKIGIAPTDPKKIGTRKIRVTDFGCAFREVDSVGAATKFARTARKIAEEHGIEVGKHSLFLDVLESDIYEAVCTVSIASWQVAKTIYEKLSDIEDEDIVQGLRERLARVFGETGVIANAIVGASTKEWQVTAVVAANDNSIVFQLVKDAANSVYKTATLFSDLARLEKPVRGVSVFDGLAEANPEHVRLLSQSSRVIDLSAQDSFYRNAAMRK